VLFLGSEVGARRMLRLVVAVEEPTNRIEHGHALRLRFQGEGETSGLADREQQGNTASVTVRARLSWFVVAIFAGLGVCALLLHGVTGIVLALLALIPIVLVRRARLTADSSGVTVVNLLRTQRIPWSEISDFRLGRVARTTCLDVCKWDGSRVHSWVATSSGDTAYQRYVINGIVSDLRERLAYGEPATRSFDTATTRFERSPLL
jgi:hypothetical protein